MNPFDTLGWIDSHLIDPPTSISSSSENPPTEGKPDPIPCTLQELLAYCCPENYIFWTPQLELGLLTGLAVSVSLRFPGLPLWMFHVGPPSSGKSLLNRAIGGHRMSVEISKMTGLISGIDEEGTDIIHDILGRVWCNKDFTMMLEMPQAQLCRFFGESRDAYDGSTSTRSLTGKKVDLNNVNYSCLLAVTHDIMARDFTALGERFLKVDITSPDDGGMDDLMMNMDDELRKCNQASLIAEDPDAARESAEFQLRRMTAGFLDSLWNLPVEDIRIHFDEESKKTIGSVASFLAHTRTQARTDRTDGWLYRPVSEIPRRASRQLLRLAFCLCVVQGKQEMDQQVLSQVVRVALDSVYGFSRDILMRLFKEHETGLTTDELVGICKMPKTTLDNRMKHLESLGLAYRVNVKPAEGGRGRYRNCWYMADKMYDWLKFAQERVDPSVFALHPVQHFRKNRKRY